MKNPNDKSGTVTSVRFNKGKSSNKKYYVPPEHFAQEYQKSLEQNKPTLELINCFKKIANNYYFGNKGKWNNCDSYAFLIDNAVTEAYLKWESFDPAISSNLFSYFTEMIKNDLISGFNNLIYKKDKRVSIDAIYNCD